MSKVDAPAIEPTAPQPSPVSQPVRSRGKHIDFTPRRAKKPAEKSNITIVVNNPPAPAPAPVIVAPVETAPEEIDAPEETIIIAAPAVESAAADFSPASSNDPLADFNELGSAETEEELEASLANFADEDAPMVEAQEDFITEESPDDYVEEVLSQISETRTETTVRRSPFLKNYSIEKRPLSSRVPAREQLPSADAIAPTPRKEYREEEFTRRADTAPDNAEEPIITNEEKTGSRLGMAITILVTILLGAGVGVFVYLAFFQ